MSKILTGHIVRLEPLDDHHAEGLARASMLDDGLYQWSPVPKGIEEARKYIQTAKEWRAAGMAEPFAIVRLYGNAVIGSSGIFNIDRWAW